MLCCVVLCLFCDMKLTVGRIPPYSCYSFGCLVTFISSSSPSEFWSIDRIVILIVDCCGFSLCSLRVLVRMSPCFVSVRRHNKINIIHFVKKYQKISAFVISLILYPRHFYSTLSTSRDTVTFANRTIQLLLSNFNIHPINLFMCHWLIKYEWGHCS